MKCALVSLFAYQIYLSLCCFIFFVVWIVLVFHHLMSIFFLLSFYLWRRLLYLKIIIDSFVGDCERGSCGLTIRAFHSLRLLTSFLFIVFEAADAGFGHRLWQLLLLLGLRSTSEPTFNLGVSAAVADREVDISVDFINSVRTIDNLRGTGLLAIST